MKTRTRCTLSILARPRTKYGWPIATQLDTATFGRAGFTRSDSPCGELSSFL
ncbi:hypothetical protein M413DRAFT_441991 [Hebeloma cylindrosporum]|uniref:Uncharacterized protein n=1 Tax=Hebeloma cylindrosporum TaxID=76867 RepID=A0A0C3CMG1_HEBCY|nr:hypothetical protein M413DRAFT_441991 [Hebeloma cylindrosporum h7]